MSAEGPVPGRLPPGSWKIIAVVILAPFMTMLDTTIVNVSLSAVRDDLRASISAAQWVISGYLLALALMLPLNGWLVDRFGTKRLYLACFSAFTLASVLCGLARTMPELVLARVIQGSAGGLLAPLTQLMMARVAGAQMARAFGYATLPVLIAPMIGPVLAGAILKHAGWPWLFFVNLPVGVIAVAAAAIVLPREEDQPRKRPFDVRGFLLVSPGLACLLYGLERLTHREGTPWLAGGAVLIAMFAWHARRAGARGLIDLELFRIRAFAVAATNQFLSNGIFFAGQFLVPLYLISGCGLTAAQAGWLLAPAGIGTLFVNPFMGRLTDRWGCRTVASTGVMLNILSTIPFLWMTSGGLSQAVALTAMVLRGIGQAATAIPSISAAYASVPRERLSDATTSMNIVQRVGGPIATTALAVILSMSEEGAKGSQSFRLPFVALMALQLLLLISAIRLPMRAPGMAAQVGADDSATRLERS